MVRVGVIFRNKTSKKEREFIFFYIKIPKDSVFALCVVAKPGPLLHDYCYFGGLNELH